MARDGATFRYAVAKMFVTASSSLGYTLALLATFVGIGIVVNVVVIYIVAQVVAERKQNREANAANGG